MGCVPAETDDGFERREGVFRVVLVPDTQCYSLLYPEILEAQGQWIEEHLADLDIRAVAHLGDITENNEAAQWDVARRAFAPLVDSVPVVLSPGNHDLGPRGSAIDRSSMLEGFFPLGEMAAAPGFAESFRGEAGNTAWFFEGERHAYVWIGVEFAPRDAVVQWVHDVLAAHPERIGIISTHAYLDADGQRYDHTNGVAQAFCPYEYGVAMEDANDGQELFDGAIAPNANARLVFSGHVPNGFAHRVDSNEAGADVHQLMADYQTGTRCPETGGDGNGFLLALELEEDERSVLVRVRSYSPWLAEFRPDHALEFSVSAP